MTKQYAKEPEVTSRALCVLDEEAFRNVALDENFFRLLERGCEAPVIFGAASGP